MSAQLKWSIIVILITVGIVLNTDAFQKTYSPHAYWSNQVAMLEKLIAFDQEQISENTSSIDAGLSPEEMAYAQDELRHWTWQLAQDRRELAEARSQLVR